MAIQHSRYNTNAISGFGVGPATPNPISGGGGGSGTITRGFESGDFSNWTFLDSGAFEIVSSPLYEGSYTAQSTQSSASDMFSSVTTDSYSALSWATNNDSASLSDVRPIVKYVDGGKGDTQVIDWAIDDSGVVGDSGSVIIHDGTSYVDTGVNVLCVRGIAMRCRTSTGRPKSSLTPCTTPRSRRYTPIRTRSRTAPVRLTR